MIYEGKTKFFSRRGNLKVLGTNKIDAFRTIEVSTSFRFGVGSANNSVLDGNKATSLKFFEQRLSLTMNFPRTTSEERSLRKLKHRLDQSMN